MSERYALQFKSELEEQFGVLPGAWNFSSSYNISVRDTVPVVRYVRGRPEAATLRWGLIPYTSRGVAGERPLIMATIEKLDSSYPWKGPWMRGQRCILPALGFYKWHQNPQGKKLPYFVRLVDDEVFGIAGIWERSITADGEEIRSCALITMPANSLVFAIHNTGKFCHRMPAILRREDYHMWLSGTPRQASRALRLYPAERMVAYPVSPRIASSEADDAELIEPLYGRPPEGLES